LVVLRTKCHGAETNAANPDVGPAECIHMHGKVLGSL
jgi:hypothetical protein